MANRSRHFVPNRENPPRMVLTARDLEILRAVHAFRFMTTEQICALLFSPTTKSSCLKRLRLLFDNGYLERFCFPDMEQQIFLLVHRLGRRGAEELAREQGVDLKKFSYWGKHDDRHHLGDTEIGFIFLKHELRINDVRVAVLKAAEWQGCQVEKWIDGSTLKSETMRDYVTVAKKQDERQKVAVIPDGYFALLTPRRAHFFLELDYGTEDLKKWRTKIRAYQAYTKSSGDRPSLYQKRYGTSALRVLTVTTSAQRLTNLKKATEQAEGKARYWFTTFDQVAPDRILTAPIWLFAGGETLVPLISPDPQG